MIQILILKAIRIAGSTHKRAADNTLAGEGGEIHAFAFPTSPSSLEIGSTMTRAAGNEYERARVPMKWKVLSPLYGTLVPGSISGPWSTRATETGSFSKDRNGTRQWRRRRTDSDISYPHL